MSVLSLSHFVLDGFCVCMWCPAIFSAFWVFNAHPSLLLFYPCVLLPNRISFLESLFPFPFLANVCIFFLCVNTCLFSFVLLDSGGSCLHAHTPFSLHSWADLGIHTHPHDAPLSSWCLAHGDTPIVASGAPVAVPASSKFLEGVIQVGKKLEEKPEVASGLRLRVHPGKEAGFEEPGEGPQEAPTSEASKGRRPGSRTLVKEDKTLRWFCYSAWSWRSWGSEMHLHWVEWLRRGRRRPRT